MLEMNSPVSALYVFSWSIYTWIRKTVAVWDRQGWQGRDSSLYMPHLLTIYQLLYYTSNHLQLVIKQYFDFWHIKYRWIKLAIAIVTYCDFKSNMILNQSEFIGYVSSSCLGPIPSVLDQISDIKCYVMYCL